MTSYMEEYEEILRKIKNVEIQGARNIAKASIKAFSIRIENFEGSKEEFIKELMKIAEDLLSLRPTEPMLVSTIEDVVNFVVSLLNMSKELPLEEIKKIFSKREEFYLNIMEENIEKIAEIGSNYLPDVSRVITYCHSSTVERLLKRAYDKGKLSYVVVCETRPLYQGRITAERLADYGIEVIFIVDGGIATFAKQVDVALVGGDAVTVTGDLVNKIGTYTLARVMHTYGKSFFSALETYKFDPYTTLGFREPIEERDPKEVWDKKHKNIKIRNPAFDVTAARYINAYITEEGVVPPQMIEEVFLRAKERINKLLLSDIS